MQGTGAMSTREFETLDKVREALDSYHSVDVEGTDKMTLIDLCEIGTWSVEEDGVEVEL